MPPVPPKVILHTLFFLEGVRGVLRGERGNTFCVPAVLSCGYAGELVLVLLGFAARVTEPGGLT